jgi:hypothetical protein
MADCIVTSLDGAAESGARGQRCGTARFLHRQHRSACGAACGSATRSGTARRTEVGAAYETPGSCKGGCELSLAR